MSSETSNANTQELVTRALELGERLGELGSQLDPSLARADYEDLHLRWKAVDAEVQTVNAAMRSRMTARQRALLALAYAEMVRPLIVRWAGPTTREIYVQIMDALWASPGELPPSSRALMARIEELPEAQCDDSDRRDYVVGEALSFVGMAGGILAALDEDGGEEEAADLDDAIQDFVNGLEEYVSGRSFSPMPTQLRATALQIADDVDDRAATATMRRAVSEASTLVESALEPMARAREWPLERASGA